MHLDIYSDTVCPWCLIGKRRLEQALAERPEPDLTIRWRPFQLNPDMPAEGVDREEYLRLKFGGQADTFYDNIRQTGLADGIHFAFEKIKRQSNTLDSHRLIEFAWKKGLQDAVVEALFDAYFMAGAYIADHEVLVAVAKEAGLDGEEVRAYLASDADAQRIREEDAMARSMGINGVPFFLLNEKIAVSGAQAPEVFGRLFDHGREKAEAV